MVNALLGPERIKITLWITIITASATALLIFKKTDSILVPLFLALFVWQAWLALKQQA
jgi:hypothetical protein